jgi:formamidopyrimidine-DNA glycosylase
MPELPDITLYVQSLALRIRGVPLQRIRLASPFVLRSVTPTVEEVEGLTVEGVRRIGKRIVVVLQGERFIVLHLMVSGRLQWGKPGAKVPGRIGLAALDFASGSLIFTESSTKKRASLAIVQGDDALAKIDPGGIEVLESDLDVFREAVTRENHTLKRALTDPRILSGIGNAYSDEILHRARLSPVKLTRRLSDEEIERLHVSCREVLNEWIERLRQESGAGWPTWVTAFREEMAVHGKYRRPCPVCRSPVQRIVYANNETNYCAECQTDGRLLADRALSRLLKADWPRRIEDLEEAE